MQRLFVALDLPEEVVARISVLQSGLPGARWLDPEQMHLTLRFIGDVEGHVHAEIDAALSRMHEEGFELTLSGLGCFPPRQQPRSLWIGVKAERGLSRLRNRLDRRLTKLGVEPERRRFHPHVTIARLNASPPSKLAQYLAGNAMYEAGTFHVDAFHLYISHLNQSGAAYERDASYDLRSQPGAHWIEDED